MSTIVRAVACQAWISTVMLLIACNGPEGSGPDPALAFEGNSVAGESTANEEVKHEPDGFTSSRDTVATVDQLDEWRIIELEEGALLWRDPRNRQDEIPFDLFWIDGADDSIWIYEGADIRHGVIELAVERELDALSFFETDPMLAENNSDNNRFTAGVVGWVPATYELLSQYVEPNQSDPNRFPEGFLAPTQPSQSLNELRNIYWLYTPCSVANREPTRTIAMSILPQIQAGENDRKADFIARCSCSTQNTYSQWAFTGMTGVGGVQTCHYSRTVTSTEFCSCCRCFVCWCGCWDEPPVITTNTETTTTQSAPGDPCVAP